MIQTFRNWDGKILGNSRLSKEKMTIIAGPCMFESYELGLEVGTFLKKLCDKYNFNYVFKSSFDKANRTSGSSVRGPGANKGLEWLAKIKKELNVPVLTDVHDARQVLEAAEVVDIIQIPAFLFRERSILDAAVLANKVIQIKKGQWATPEDMLEVAKYVEQKGNHKIILVERGSLFGYNNLVVDFRNLVEMSVPGFAVVFDATHAVQLPGAKNGKSSGLRNMVLPLTRAAVAVGVSGIFMEVHTNPNAALSDADTQLSFSLAEEVLTSIKNICP